MLTRRTLLQGVLSLAALGPLARVAVAEERRQRDVDTHHYVKAVYHNGEWIAVEDSVEVRALPNLGQGPTVMRARFLFGTWASDRV